MYKIIGISVLSFLFVACSNAQEEVGTKEKEVTGTVENDDQQTSIVSLVSVSEFKELMKNESAQLLDVRTPEEYSAGKIGDATNINFFDQDFKSQIATLDKTRPVLVYCASGRRSAQAVSMMKSMGFSEIHELKGGYNGWN